MDIPESLHDEFQQLEINVKDTIKKLNRMMKILPEWNIDNSAFDISVRDGLRKLFDRASSDTITVAQAISWWREHSSKANHPEVSEMLDYMIIGIIGFAAEKFYETLNASTFVYYFGEGFERDLDALERIERWQIRKLGIDY